MERQMIFSQTFGNERALYGIRHADIEKCRFEGPEDGESALKETSDIRVADCAFSLRYPFWHTKQAEIRRCELYDTCRAALWYASDVSIADSSLCGIKALRECSRVRLSDTVVNSPEFGWKCTELDIKDCEIHSEYPFFESRGIQMSQSKLFGKYSFQYVENAEFRSCRFDTKDAFWHAKNVTLEDCVIDGMYLGWYSENLRLIRCQISGTQPFCYCKGLVLDCCTMTDTDLCFERSDVEATILGHVISIKNPGKGHIRAGDVGEWILEPEYCDADHWNKQKTQQF